MTHHSTYRRFDIEILESGHFLTYIEGNRVKKLKLAEIKKIIDKQYTGMPVTTIRVHYNGDVSIRPGILSSFNKTGKAVLKDNSEINSYGLDGAYFPDPEIEAELAQIENQFRFLDKQRDTAIRKLKRVTLADLEAYGKKEEITDAETG